jgi:hypothetical protein
MPTRRLAVTLLLALAMPLGACLDQAPSLHPLFAAPDAVEVDIAGDWVDKDELQLTFTQESGGYGLEVRGKDCDENDCVLHLDVSFGRIGDQLFADFIADDSDDLFGTWPVHAFARVQLAKDTLEFRVLDREWLRLRLEKKPSSIAHEITDGHVVLTAKTSDLKKAMAEWMRDDAAFGKTVSFARRADAGQPGH